MIDEGTANFKAFDKNGITIRHLNKSNFLDRFDTAGQMIIIMPGSNNDIRLSLKGTSEALSRMAECTKFGLGKFRSKNFERDA